MQPKECYNYSWEKKEKHENGIQVVWVIDSCEVDCYPESIEAENRWIDRDERLNTGSKLKESRKWWMKHWPNLPSLIFWRLDRTWEDPYPFNWRLLDNTCGKRIMIICVCAHAHINVVLRAVCDYCANLKIINCKLKQLNLW